MKTKVFYLLTFLIFFVGILVWKEYRPVYTPEIKNKDGKTLSGSISRLEEIDIGGMKQWIQIRGEDVSNPVLLWLHGGPCSAQMPIAQYFNKRLEKDFVVVHWDQRGAGKSNPRDFDETTMTFEQYLEDTYQITQYLKRQLSKEKIYLLGHSWGSKIGLTISRQRPEDYYAFIGVSQLIANNEKSQDISYKWLLDRIERKNKADLKKLEQLGLPPYNEHKEYIKFINLVGAYGGGMDVSMAKLALIGLRSPEYRLSDFVRWLDGANRGSGPMWETYITWDAFKEVPEVDVPVYFFSGKDDFNTPMQLVREYFEVLKAPKGKKLIIFENSSHTPFIKEPEKFYTEMLKVKNETYIIE